MQKVLELEKDFVTSFNKVLVLEGNIMLLTMTNKFIFLNCLNLLAKYQRRKIMICTCKLWFNLSYIVGSRGASQLGGVF